MTEVAERKGSSLSKGVKISALFFEDVEAECVCLIWHGTHHLQCNNGNVSSYTTAPHSYVRLSTTHKSQPWDPQSTWVTVKKGITSPSRGSSQHRSQTQMRAENCLSCSSTLLTELLTHSLFNKWIQTATRESSPKPQWNTPATTEPSFCIWSIYPLLDETQNYSSPCKVTSSWHAIFAGARTRGEKDG